MADGPSQYANVVVVLLVAMAIGGLALIVGALLGPRRPTRAKLQTYESGVEPIGSARQRFPVRYYLTAIVFLVFGVEIAFLYPYAALARELGVYGLVAVMVFIFVLVVGFFYDWRKGALKWD